MKVSDAVVEVAAKARFYDETVDEALQAMGFAKDDRAAIVRAIAEAALPMVVGEAVAEVRSDQDGDMAITASKALALGTKLYTLANPEDAP